MHPFTREVALHTVTIFTRFISNHIFSESQIKNYHTGYFTKFPFSDTILGMKGTIYGIFAIVTLLVCIGIGLFRLGAVRCRLDVIQAQETQIRQKIQTETEISRRVLSIPDDDNLQFLLVSHLRAD